MKEKVRMPNCIIKRKEKDIGKESYMVKALKFISEITMNYI